MPVKVEQINEHLFSDTVQSQKTKSGSDKISQGQYRGYPSNTHGVPNSETLQYSSFIRSNRQHDKEHTKRLMKVRDNGALNMHRKSVTRGFLLCKYTVNRNK